MKETVMKFIRVLAFNVIMMLFTHTLYTSRAYALEPKRPPNFIIIFTDDQGYDDVGSFWAPNNNRGYEKINTPRLDKMATEGVRFTSFYAAAPVCTPSRAALLTGSYPQRVGLSTDSKGRDVLFPGAKIGISDSEITIAELLKTRGYATACIGKWHLGDRPQFLPTRYGFDSYFGIPYGNDMTPFILMRNEKVIERAESRRERMRVLETLTERYTSEAVEFITKNKDKPFFLYLPHTMPHLPLNVSKRFRGKSQRGLYGDVIEEIDWSSGVILDTLKKLGLDDSTLVIFTSDNGPWLWAGNEGGKAYPLRAGKGTTYEGGMRVPCIMRWPGKIPAGTVSSELGTTMDLLPTLAKLAGAQVPTDRIIDGKDIWPLMAGVPGAKSPHQAFYYYRMDELRAVRSGKWKLVFQGKKWKEFPYWRGGWEILMRRKKAGDINDKEEIGSYRRKMKEAGIIDELASDEFVSEYLKEFLAAPIPEALYDLEEDRGETRNVIDKYPEVAARLRRLADKMRDDLGDSRTRRLGKNRRPPGRVTKEE